jgi:hypothetical protein
MKPEELLRWICCTHVVRLPQRDLALNPQPEATSASAPSLNTLKGRGRETPSADPGQDGPEGRPLGDEGEEGLPTSPRCGQ